MAACSRSSSPASMASTRSMSAAVVSVSAVIGSLPSLCMHKCSTPRAGSHRPPPQAPATGEAVILSGLDLTSAALQARASGHARTCLLRTRVNSARERAGSKDPALVISASDLLLVARLLQACALLLLHLARGLGSMFERNAAERFGPLLEEALV
jgi:hypothetical protein